MLLAEQRWQEAYDAYLQALQRSPRRLNSMDGAAIAAERMGKRDLAKRQYQDLLQSTAADTKHSAVVRARAFLAKGS
jgi:predicted TPR repeat methyltransferase